MKMPDREGDYKDLDGTLSCNQKNLVDKEILEVMGDGGRRREKI